MHLKSLIWSIISLFQRPYLHSLGVGSKISLHSRIHGFTKNISIGKNVNIGRYATIFCDTPKGKLSIDDSTNIGISTIVKTYGGSISIGRNCSINPFSVVYGHGGVVIQDNVRIASHVVIVPSNHIFEDRDTLIVDQGLSKKGITIEEDVWIGSGATVLDGCTIGRGSVIAAGAVVTKSFPPYSIIAGIPGKLIRVRGEK
ncbi:MAG: acyltransferase [Oscillatoriales cyanobacterium]|nr:MAG: acyltransferase [Oscillatoriales cyanobacterium]